MHSSAASVPPQYRERVLPGPLWWITVGALIAMLAIAYGAALGSTAGLWVVIVAAPVAALALWRSSPVIEVRPEGITAGLAVLPLDAVGSVLVLRGQELSAARRGFDPRVPINSFVVIAPWSPRAAVVISNNDDTDPHRTWVIASRRAEDLAERIAHEATNRPDGSREPPEFPGSPDSRAPDS